MNTEELREGWIKVTAEELKQMAGQVEMLQRKAEIADELAAVLSKLYAAFNGAMTTEYQQEIQAILLKYKEL